MAGVYIHIPFCKQKCHYCDFHFSTTYSSYYDRMISSLIKEIELNKSFLNDETIKTIYFGGGTPSLLKPSDIQQLIDVVSENFNCEIEEITLEANPDDLTNEFFIQLEKSDVNRLSIGIQSFENEVLNFMNRAHNGPEAIDSVKKARGIGIENISIDLIYGIPGKDLDYWKRTVDKVLGLNVQHVSAYSLTIEPGTVFGVQKEKGILKGIPDEEELQQFLYLEEELRRNGIERYEVSNFAKLGSESKHNSAYWNRVPYVGIGPSAHSFKENYRRWNVSNNVLYMRSLELGLMNFEEEYLTDEDVFNEVLLTGLRTRKGVSLSSLSPTLRTRTWEEKLEELIQSGRVLLKSQHIYLKDENLFLADGLASELFV